MSTPETRAKRAAYMREWTRRNPLKVAAIAKKSYDKNIDKRRAGATARRLRNGAKYDAAKREKYSACPETRMRVNATATAWRLANPERYKENQRRAGIRTAEARRARSAKWKLDNPERAKVNAIEYSHRRRARMLGNGKIDPRM